MNAVAETAGRPPLRAGLRMIAVLGGVAMMSGFLIVFAYQATLPRILENRRDATERAVFSVLPGADARVTFAVDGGNLNRVDTTAAGQEAVYAGYRGDGTLVGVAVEASGQGYQDVVRVLYGYSLDQSAVIGFSVLESKETPGLGDRIGKDAAFLANFEALDATVNETGDGLANAIVTVKAGEKVNPWEIDGISGATVSSVAVGRIINNSAQRMAPLLQAQAATLREAAP